MDQIRTIVAETGFYLIGGLFGLAGLIAILPGGILLLSTLTGNWDLGNPTYLLILCLGCLTPALLLTSSVLLIARPNPKYLLLGSLGFACAVGFIQAFSLPGAKNILH
ncbi:MAG TPA: hypothetical protein VGE67_00690 [Haloferula sp.]